MLSLLDRLHTDADQTRAASLLEIGMLRALTHHASGDTRQALAELNRALLAAPEPDSYVRLFLDEGAPMLALLRDAAETEDSGEQQALRRHARRLLAADGAALGDNGLGAAAPANLLPAERGGVADPLSGRELEVLRLLDSALTGPEIARQLFVSLNTLRTHTKRIFTKLDVNNRAAAVRRARELGLL
jgi:LuxR family maltose regulon positive regulatory protein